MGPDVREMASENQACEGPGVRKIAGEDQVCMGPDMREKGERQCVPVGTGHVQALMSSALPTPPIECTPCAAPVLVLAAWQALGQGCASSWGDCSESMARWG